MKKFIVALIILLAIIFLITSFSELRQIGLVLQKGNILVIGLAVLIEIGWILVLGRSFQTLFRIVGIHKELLPLARLVAAVNFVNIVAPSAGVSGMAVIYSDALKNGHSSARVTVGSLLFLLFDYFGLLTIIFVGLIILFLRNTLNAADVIAFALFLILALTLGGILYLASRSQSRLIQVVTLIARTVNKIARPFRKHEVLGEENARIFACEIVEGVQALHHVRRGWLRPLLLTLLNKLLLVSILGVIFLAFKVPTTVAVVVAGFSIAYLFVIISPTPAGVGIVEGVMTLVLKSLGIPLEAAMVVTLAYRSVTFWFPLLLGMISFRSLHQA
ncbi:MAG: lysylphosphatidylglycerol synthase transmembrane domain-containing protein [Bellilinea sp.]